MAGPNSAADARGRETSATGPLRTAVLELVSPGTRVLDLTGALADDLRARGCDVVIGAPAAVAPGPAARGLAPSGAFDVILAIGCSIRPEHILHSCVDRLTPHGIVVASFPNVRHGSVRLAFLAGHAPGSTEQDSHAGQAPLYARQALSEVVRGAGLEPIHVQDVRLDPERGEALEGVDLTQLPLHLRAAVREDPESDVVAFVVVAARPKAEGLLGLVADLSETVTSLTVEAGRLGAEVTHLDSSLIAAREAVLSATRADVQKDIKIDASAQHILALEGRLEELGREASLGETEAQRLQIAEAALGDIYASKLWRVATVYRRWIGRLRRG